MELKLNRDRVASQPWEDTLPSWGRDQSLLQASEVRGGGGGRKQQEAWLEDTGCGCQQAVAEASCKPFHLAATSTKGVA